MFFLPSGSGLATGILERSETSGAGTLLVNALVDVLVEVSEQAERSAADVARIKRVVVFIVDWVGWWISELVYESECLWRSRNVVKNRDCKSDHCFLNFDHLCNKLLFYHANK